MLTMGVSSRTLNTIHRYTVKGLIGAGLVGMALTVVAIQNIVSGSSNSPSPPPAVPDKKDKEELGS